MTIWGSNPVRWNEAIKKFMLSLNTPHPGLRRGDSSSVNLLDSERHLEARAKSSPLAFDLRKYLISAERQMLSTVGVICETTPIRSIVYPLHSPYLRFGWAKIIQ